MKNSLKNGKKVLSLVLSVLMIMSCFVFAPIASAEDTLKLTVKIKVTDPLSIYSDSKYFKVVVTEKNGIPHEKDILPDLKAGIGGFAGTTTIAKKSKEVEFEISSEVSQIAIVFDLHAPGRDPNLITLGLRAEAWLSGGKSIIKNGSKEALRRQGWAKEEDRFNGQHTWVLVDSNDLTNDNYPTYTIRFLDFDGNLIGDAQTVRFGENATAPALPTKAADNTYHYTNIRWNKGNAAWTAVKANADIKADATQEEHTYTDTNFAATCEEAGYINHKCDICGHEYNEKTVDALGHIYGDWVDNGDGTHTGTCTREGCDVTGTLHKIVEDHDIKRMEAKASTCIEKGWDAYEYCTKCSYSTINELPLDPNSHTNVVEDAAVEATCTKTGLTKGSHCAACNVVIVAQTDTPMKPHTAGTAVIENKVDSTCSAEGSYDEVVYCEVCHAEISRETKPIVKKAHTPAAAVKENATEATCTDGGSYDEVVYCEECGAEISRVNKTVSAKGHKAGTAVIENKVDSTCSAEGSYDEVVYCEVCHAELSRETKPIVKKAHTFGAAVKENEVAATCETDGSYDEVVYCTVCEAEISRTHKTTNKLGHNYDYANGVIDPRPLEDGTKGTITYTCLNDASHKKTEEVERAIYTEFDAAKKALEDLLGYDLTDDCRKEIQNALTEANDFSKRCVGGYKNEENKYSEIYKNLFGEQQDVDDATNKLKAVLNKYADEDGNPKDEALNHYTIVFNWHNGSSSVKYLKNEKIVVPVVENYTDTATNFTYRFLGWDKAVPETATEDATFTAKYSEPRNMDDVKEVIKDAEEVINNDDYYDEDQKKVEDAKKELEDYLDEKGVDLDKGTNPVEKDSAEDAKITELVEKLRDAINNANKNKANRDKNKHQTSGFMGWLTRLLILVKHLLGMV